jgi:hypothetical protein
MHVVGKPPTELRRLKRTCRRLLQSRAARFAELSRRAAVLEAEEGKPEEAPLRPIPQWATQA